MTVVTVFCPPGFPGIAGNKGLEPLDFPLEDSMQSGWISINLGHIEQFGEVVYLRASADREAAGRALSLAEGEISKRIRGNGDGGSEWGSNPPVTGLPTTRRF